MSLEIPSFFLNEVEKICGLSLGTEKKALLENRLSPLIEKENFIDFSSLFQESLSNPPLMRQIVDLLLTHETSFFRDPKIFSFLSEFFSEFFSRHPSRSLRVWSAACSTGQEIYSLAMMLWKRKEDFFLLGTDLSERCLEKAKTGIYTPFDIQRGIPQEKIKIFFDPHPEGWQLKKKIKEKVHFQPHNLLHPPLPEPGFDIILCRNVLLYFKPSLREKILKNLISVLSPGGFLILGSSEMPSLSSFSLNAIRGLPGVYKK